jgi:hypothetical protein
LGVYQLLTLPETKGKIYVPPQPLEGCDGCRRKAEQLGSSPGPFEEDGRHGVGRQGIQRKRIHDPKLSATNIHVVRDGKCKRRGKERKAEKRGSTNSK